MIESIYFYERDRERHRRSPLLAERERYLRYLHEIGTRRERIRNVATMLLHVVRVFKLDTVRPVEIDEVSEGCRLWLEDQISHGFGKNDHASTYAFRLTAVNWFRFQEILATVPGPVPPFGDLLPNFLGAMRSEHGLAPDTLQSYRSRVLAFLNWLEPRCQEFSRVTASNIEDFLEQNRTRWTRTTVAAHCSALRTFFEYAEQHNACSRGIRGCISSPRIPRIAENLNGPPWQEVRRVIASIGDARPADLRAKAMFLLFSIYGFRSAEVRGLTLEDVDWRRAVITVRRAKQGRTQRFPLQDEVGDAIVRYLEEARPRCSCRTLFVTLNPPYRPVSGHSMSSIVAPRLKRMGIATSQFGPHALRRACATQLLTTGTPLKDIADFLGHSDLRSVGSYAKYDPASLAGVAKFSLRDIL